MNKSRFTRFLSFLLAVTLLLTVFPAVAESPATPTDLDPVEETLEPEVKPEDASDAAEIPEEEAEPEGEEEGEPAGDADLTEPEAEPETAENEPEEKTGPSLAFLRAGARLYADKDCYRKQQILGEEAVVLVVKTSEGIGEILYAYLNVQDEPVPGAAFAKTADLRPLTEEETAAWIAAEHSGGIMKLDFPLEPVTYGAEPAPEQPGNETAGSEEESAPAKSGASESGDDAPEAENSDDPGKTGAGESDGTEGEGAEGEGAEGEGTEGGETGDASSLEAFIPGGEGFTDVLNQGTDEEDEAAEEPAEQLPEATPTDLAEAEPEAPESTGTPAVNRSEGLAFAAGPAEDEPVNKPESEAVQTAPEDSAIVYQMDEDSTLKAGFASSYNGREQGNLPATRDQNPLGACWAFATIGALEIDLIASGLATTAIDLSELFLAYYASHNYPYVEGGDQGDSVSFDNSVGPYEDNGGGTMWAYRLLANMIGTVLESTAPYVNNKEGAGELTVNGYRKIAAQIAGAYNIKPDDRDAVKQAILDHGSVAIGIQAVNSAGMHTVKGKDGKDYYVSYNPDTNCMMGNCPETNHVVLLVGWDDNFSAQKFAVDGYSWPSLGNGAWLVRNSWTTSSDYGLSGYFWISYYDVGLNKTMATAFDAVNNAGGKEIADYCYSYDKAAYSSTARYWKTASPAKLSTTFAIKGKEKLQAVGVETGSDNQKISVEVKIAGKTVATGSATAKYQGFYRIKLNTPYAAMPGMMPEVVVTLTSTDGSDIVFPYESPGTATISNIHITAGQGGGFYLNDTLMTGDPMIKLYTQKNGTSAVDPTHVTMSSSTLSLSSGQSAKLTAKTDKSSNPDNLVWTSSDESIAIVDQLGTVYGVGGDPRRGTQMAVITAMAPNGVYDTCTVSVAMGRVSLSSVKIKYMPESKSYTYSKDNTPKGFTYGSPVVLEAETNPQYADLQDLTWKWNSSDTSVMKVESYSNGSCKVTMLKNGTAKITVTATSKSTGASKTDYVNLTMALPVPVTGIWIAYSRKGLTKGTGFQMDSQIYPSNATNKGIVWTSSNTSVVTVSSTGYLTPVGGGTATVTATSAENKNISISCEVTVTVPVTGITATVDGFGSAAAYTIDGSMGHRVGSTLSLSAKVTPSDASNQGISWQSSDTSVLALKDNGNGTCTLTIKKDGTSTITATARDKTNGTKSAGVKLTVAITVPVTSVSIDYDSCALLEGESIQLTGSVSPNDATNKRIIWSSSNTAVATVSSNGYVEGLTDGKAVITATAESGGASASCEVTVQTSDPVKAFVYRMYRVCLLREPDQGGLDYWMEQLKSGKQTGAQLVQGFYCSLEMINRHLSNSEFMDRAYEGIMNRNPDPAGKAYWVSYLDKGVSYAYIVAGFTNSPEFTQLCANYGIVRGDYTSGEARDQNPGVTAYVSRLYTKMLGRGYDSGGLNYWCSEILKRPSKETLLDVALSGFMHSLEFLGKNLDDTEFVRVMYRTFLDRESDAGGLQYWVGELQSGRSRDDIALGFAVSDEFGRIMAQFGL